MLFEVFDIIINNTIWILGRDSGRGIFKKFLTLPLKREMCARSSKRGIRRQLFKYILAGISDLFLSG